MNNDSDNGFSDASFKAFLLTFSPADTIKCPKCLGVLDAFSEIKSTKMVREWPCCLENHNEASVKHYHMCINLASAHHWKTAKKLFCNYHGISVKIFN